MYTMITAHSGADGTPDNSLSYLRRALSLSVDALEIDIRRGDGGLVLSHDLPPEDAVSLDAALAMIAAHPSMKVNCDLKEPGLEDAVCTLAAPLAGRLILTGTVDPAAVRGRAEVCLNIEEHIPDFYRRYREEADFPRRAAAEIAPLCRDAGIRTINVCHWLVTRPFLDALAAEGLGVSAWTADEPEHLAWLFAAGVDNVTTRRTDLALSIRETVQ